MNAKIVKVQMPFCIMEEEMEEETQKKEKQKMIGFVKNYLSRFNFEDYERKILNAMLEADRKKFMPGMESYAYADNAMPIGKGQTISQPSTVARMLQLLDLKEGDDVLEIGTGSGWNAAIIIQLTKSRVVTLEIIDELRERAEKRLAGFKNIEVRKENFRKLDEKFDKIIFTAGILHGQEKIIEGFAGANLNPGGILICPYQSGPLIIIKKNGRLRKEHTEENYVFVELVI